MDLLPSAKLLRCMFWVGGLALLGPTAADAQPDPHPAAERALSKLVLEKDYAGGLSFDSRDIVTLATNDRVPGLNGLMFVRWKGEDVGTEITVSIQWFERLEDLRSFYTTSPQSQNFTLGDFAGTKIWQIGGYGYAWTDGRHFLISLAGNPTPPDEMVNDWLALIENRVEGFLVSAAPR